MWNSLPPTPPSFFFKIFFFFDVDHFKSLDIVSVLCFGFSGHKACAFFVPGPGIKPAPSMLAGEVLATGPRGKPLLSHLDWSSREIRVQVPPPSSVTILPWDPGRVPSPIWASVSGL